MTEKRKFKRIQILATVLIKIQSEELKVVAYNISQKGLRFVIPMDVKVGEDILVYFTAESTEQPLAIQSKAVRIDKIKSNAQVCNCGVEFSDIIEMNILHKIVERF